MMWARRHDHPGDDTLSGGGTMAHAEPAVRILRTGEEISDALRRAAGAEQRVRAEITHRYGHYYSMAGWDTPAPGGPGEAAPAHHGARRRELEAETPPPGLYLLDDDCSVSPWQEDVRVFDPRPAGEEPA